MSTSNRHQSAPSANTIGSPSNLVNAENYLPLGVLTPIDAGSDPFDTARGSQPGSSHPLHADVQKLTQAGWIRIVYLGNNGGNGMSSCRVYVLPDDVARGQVQREDRYARKALARLFQHVDPRSTVWEGGDTEGKKATYEFDDDQDESLFYVFNTLESPQVEVDRIDDQDLFQTISDFLGGQESFLGLMTSMYPFQRRSAACMVARESHPRLITDPRLKPLIGPTSLPFFYDPLLKKASLYQEVRGGILAETMGYGKTLIMLAVIASTKNHTPQVPPECIDTRTFVNESGCRRLSDMVAYRAVQCNLPWKRYFHNHAEQGDNYDQCLSLIKKIPMHYRLEAPNPRNSSRRVYEGKIMYPCSTTLIIVPNNLLIQWRDEITKHVQSGSLSLLIVDSMKEPLPFASEMVHFDVVLMWKARFEQEMNPEDYGAASQLSHMHFLRLVVDEGHSFASSGTSKASAGLSQIRAERRWIISGTPTSGLVGAEIDLAASELSVDKPGSISDYTDDATIDCTRSALPSSPAKNGIHHKALQQQRKRRVDDDQADLRKLGKLVMDFLKVQPWSNSRTEEDSASWSLYTKISDRGGSSTASVRNILQSLIVRHKIEDIEAELPPLYNKVVHLEPCCFDKLSLNLFTLVLAANAVTSERVDQDYMFHPKNRRPLDMLIRNLRHAGFYWCGFSMEDVVKSLKNCSEYLAKDTATVCKDDKDLLGETVNYGQQALDSKAWETFSDTKEVGLFVSGLPEAVHKELGISASSRSSGPLTLLCARYTQLIQKHVLTNLFTSDPLQTLADSVHEIAGDSEMSKNVLTDAATSDNTDSRRGVPSSGMQVLSSLTPSQFNMHRSPTKSTKTSKLPHAPDHVSPKTSSGLKSALKRRLSHSAFAPTAEIERVKAVRLVGTASSKLTYLLDRIVDLHSTEKILVFYEADHIAWYIAQGLETLGIKYFIYANRLTSALRTRYLQSFSGDSEEKVMLMDLRQGSHGLNIVSATRIFFVNPVWQVSIEAQAIKRAHRIGQTRPVYVETLVLKGTIEEKMLHRRRTMTTDERHKAKSTPLDDEEMTNIIKNAKFIPITQDELDDQSKQVALLKAPKSLFPSLVGDTENSLQASNETMSMPYPSPRPMKKSLALAELTGEVRNEVRSDVASRPKKVARFA